MPASPSLTVGVESSTSRQHQPPPKVIEVALWLRVERNNKYVRGQKKAREDIERWVMGRYRVEQPTTGQEALPHKR